MSGGSSAVVRLPDDAWRDPRMRRAWRTHNFRAVFLHAGRLGLTAEMIADSSGLPLDLVVKVIRGDTIPKFSSGAVESIARGLGMPDELRPVLGLTPHAVSPGTVPAMKSRKADTVNPISRPPDRQPQSGVFHTELLRLMTESGVGVRELARRTYYTAGYISHVCSAQRIPSSEAVELIDRALEAGGRLIALARPVEDEPVPSRRADENARKRPVADTVKTSIWAARKARGWPVRKMAEVLRGLAEDPDSLPPVYALIRMIRYWEAGLHTPSEKYRLMYCEAFGKSEDELFPHDQVTVPVRDGQAVAREAPASEDKQLVERLRRTLLAGGLAALTLPALGLDELRHITSAVTNAQRYADSDIVDYCRRQLDDCATNDGRRGPRQSLPIMLGLIAAIEKMAIDAKADTRRELLRVGAYAAEFTGWLYRDIAAPELANYWRDRSIEWAQVSGDMAMQGYVLLKKSQAVWDERDALRMLTLAEAVQEGPWQLPARVRAEAAQQQARGHAMLDGNLRLIEAKLSEARSLLAQDRATAEGTSTEVASHYDEALFGIQVAICYCEVRQPERALELYESWLSPETFSRRDYAYFLSLKGAAHAVAKEPEKAGSAGLQALSLARETESVRTMQELIRLAMQLEPWCNVESVHALRESVLVN